MLHLTMRKWSYPVRWWPMLILVLDRGFLLTGKLEIWRIRIIMFGLIIICWKTHRSRITTLSFNMPRQFCHMSLWWMPPDSIRLPTSNHMPIIITNKMLEWCLRYSKIKLYCYWHIVKRECLNLFQSRIVAVPVRPSDLCLRFRLMPNFKHLPAWLS